MIDIGKGIISGLVATGVVSGIVYLCSMTGLASGFDPIRVLSGVAIWPLGLGWVLHFALGAFVWGTLFAVLSPILPGPGWCKGLAFGAVAWGLAIASSWSLELGESALIGVMSAALHLAFGAVLGGTYVTLTGPGEGRRPGRLYS